MLFQGSLLEGFPIEINQFIVPVPQAELCGGLHGVEAVSGFHPLDERGFPGSGEA